MDIGIEAAYSTIERVNAAKTFYNCHVGVVMKNSTFTKGTSDLANATGVLLWDIEYIEKLQQ